MTKALINNLSTITEKFIKSNNDHIGMDYGSDFKKVLDKKLPAGYSKTKESNANNNSEDEQSLSLASAIASDNTETSLLITSENFSETEAETKLESEIAEELVTIAIAEKAEDTFDLNSIQDELLANENSISENPSAENDSLQNSVTPEEETMNNKLSHTLETSSSIAILQQQTMQSNNADSIKDTDNVNPYNDNSSKCKLNTSIKFNEITDIENTNISDKNTDKCQNVKNTAMEHIIEDALIEDLNIESISTNTDTEAFSGDIMNHQTPQEHGIKAILQPELKYEEVKVKTTSNTGMEEINTEKIIEQISKQLDSIKGNVSRVNMVLNPNSLGKILLQIINTKDGLSAQMSVSSQEVKTLLMNSVNELKDCLLSQGINVDNISVKLIENEDNENKQDFTEKEGSRGGNKQQGNFKKKENEKQFEQMMFEINNNGNV